MLFLAASKGNYFTVDSGIWWGLYEEPWERTNMVEYGSNTKILFSSQNLA